MTRLLEDVALRAWPALERADLDGWILLAAGGYTKRANSVQPHAGSTLPLAGKVDRCERWYAARTQPCIFRLTPISDSGLDEYLAARGYVTEEPSHVLHRPIPGAERVPFAPSLRRLEVEEWLETWARLTERPGGFHPAMRSMVRRVAGGLLLAGIDAEDAGVVSCGMGVLDVEHFGLFNVVTHSEHRRRGYGTALVTAMLGWAQERGAARSYLQVVEENIVARRVYEGLGFELAYPYWYRVRP